MLTVSAPDGIGLYNPSNSYFDLRHTDSAGVTDLSLAYGTPNDGWKAVIGDWNADAIDTVGAYDPTSASFFYLRNTNTTGSADSSFGFGAADAGWLPIAGDWDGAGGYDTIGLYDPSSATFYLRNSNSAGYADLTFGFGGANWQPVAGDWNGDGVDSIGVYVGGTFYLRNTNSTGDPNYYVGITDAPTSNVKAIAGDWNGDGIYSVGLFYTPTATFYLRNTNSSGPADYVFSFGSTNDTRQPVAGHWSNWYPRAYTDAYNVNEDNTLSVGAPGVLANDVDPEGETITAELVSGVSPAQGTLSLNANGSFTYNPAANFYGSASFTYRTNPGQVEINPRTATVTVTVNNVNDAPTLTTVSTLSGSPEDNSTTITYAALAAAANEADIDSGSISFRVESVTSGTLTKNGSAVTPGTTLLGSGEQWVWAPAANANGTLPAFTVRAWDGALASASAIQAYVSVAAVNDAPTLTAVNTLAGAAEDNPTTITYSTLAGAANEADYDSGSISFRVESVTSGTLTKNGSAVTPGTTLLSSGEQWVWTPAANANSTLPAFTVRAWDGALASDNPIQVGVYVSPVNDTPTLNAIASPSAINEDSGQQTVNFSGVTAGGGESQYLQVTASSSNTAIVPTPTVTYTSPNATGVLAYTPVPNSYGTVTVTVTVRDWGLDGVLGNTDDAGSHTVLHCHDQPDYRSSYPRPDRRPAGDQRGREQPNRFLDWHIRPVV